MTTEYLLQKHPHHPKRHPEVTRYFMTIPEAAQLVIQVDAMAKGAMCSCSTWAGP